MTRETDPGTPTSPESQSKEVREELEQDNMTHKGDWRKATDGARVTGGQHLGALEDETVPIVPPMSGPADLLGDDAANGQGNETGKTKTGEETFDPRTELTPG